MIAQVDLNSDRVVVTLVNGLTVEYVKPKVQLTGEDGNAFAILSKVKKALRRIDPIIESAYLERAMEGDYDHLLRVTMDFVEVQ